MHNLLEARYARHHRRSASHPFSNPFLARFARHLSQPFYVTFLQLSQMFIGMATCCLSAMLYQSYTLDSKPHFIHVNNLIAAFVMYASYFVLFAKFAWDYAERLGLSWAQRGR